MAMRRLCFDETNNHKNVDELLPNLFFCGIYLQLTNVRINNVFNDFIMLANTQFVENVRRHMLCLF